MKKSNLQVIFIILFVFFISAPLVSAKHGGSSPRSSYAWEPKNSSEKIIEYIRIGTDDELWAHSIYKISVELEGMREIPPEILDKLDVYSKHILERLLNSHNVDEVMEISKILTIFKEKGVENLSGIQKLARHQYVFIGKELIYTLHEMCKNKSDTKYVLRDIDTVLATGVSLQEIGVSSIEEMRDLALCR